MNVRPLLPLSLSSWLSFILILGACGDDNDQIMPLPGDAATSADATTTPDAGLDAADIEGLLASPEELNPDPDDDGARCVESAEDERGAPLGCEDTGCRAASHACCVGRAECCSDTPETFDYHFDTCTTDCVDGVLFGSPLPTLINGFSPGGDAEFDSGVVLDERIDLRGETVRLEADFVVPSTECSGLNCFQTVGVSVARNAPANSSAHVRTIAGLLWSGGRMYLIVGDRSIQNWASESGGVWNLAINADGDVRVHSPADGSDVDETFDVAVLPSEAYIVLHGHNVNPGGGAETAQLRSLTISRNQCEMTRQWSERSAIEVGSGLTDRLVGVTSPTSVLGPDGRLRIAYIREGRLVTTLRGSDDTPSVWVAVDDTSSALLDSDGMDLGGDIEIAGPELANEGGQLTLYYEVDGVIFRAEATDDERLRFAGGEAITSVSAPGATVHAPTFASRGDGLEGALVVRVRYADQRSTLVAFSLMNEGGVVSARLRDYLPTESLGDELGDPELFIRNRLYQLYVPYRRGTRWRLAHMTSVDFVYWTIADYAALEAGGADELFGPRAPSAVVSEAGVELFYERFDGSEQSIGRIFRRTPITAMLQSRL